MVIDLTLTYSELHLLVKPWEDRIRGKLQRFIVANEDAGDLVSLANGIERAIAGFVVRKKKS